MKRICFLLICLLVGRFAQAGQTTSLRYLAPAGTQSVALTGTFNNWAPLLMTDADGDGWWEISLPLGPGTWEYRFLVDGKHWMRDPLNPEFGGAHSNSILRISPELPRITRAFPAPGSCLKDSGVTVTIWLTADLTIDYQLKIDEKVYPATISANPPRVSARVGQLADGLHRLQFQLKSKTGATVGEMAHLFLVNQHDQPPVAHAGFHRVVAVNETFSMNGGLSFDPDLNPIDSFEWKQVHGPGRANPDSLPNSPFPELRLPAEGRYIFSLQVHAGGLTSTADSVAIVAFQQTPKLTSFGFHSKNFQPTVSQVHLAGEFNRWNPQGTELQRIQDSLWQIQLPLANGEYEYKFVVNGNQWLPDPQNPVQVSDGWQGVNSVKSVYFPELPAPSIALEKSANGFSLELVERAQPAPKKISLQLICDQNFPIDCTWPENQNLYLPENLAPGNYFFQLLNRSQNDFSVPQNYLLRVTEDTYSLINGSSPPAWCRDAVIYEIYVRKFSESGDLAGVRRRLDYLADLGINCIWLMPIFDGPTEHGYGPTDFFQIESDYGTLTDCQELIRAAHQKGIRVVLDFIANHTSDQHPYFLAAFRNSKSVFRNWYYWRADTLQADGLIHGFHNDWDTLPNLNYENPQVWQFMLGIARFWLQAGVDGFRCDVAWGVPHRFWKTFRREVKEINPECLLLNEVLPRSPAYHHDEFDMSYDTDFYGNLLDVLRQKKEVAALDYGLRKTFKNYPANTLNLRYLENHDMPRFLREFGEPRTRLAAALLLTYPGTPLLLYGQETGVTEPTGLMNWNAPDSSLFHFSRTLIHLRRQHPALRSDEIINLPTENPTVYAYVRQSPSEKFLIVLNFSGAPVQFRLELPPEFSRFGSQKTRYLADLLSQSPATFSADRLELKLDPFQPLIFHIHEH